MGEITGNASDSPDGPRAVRGAKVPCRRRPKSLREASSKRSQSDQREERNELGRIGSPWRLRARGRYLGSDRTQSRSARAHPPARARRRAPRGVRAGKEEVAGGSFLGSTAVFAVGQPKFRNFYHALAAVTCLGCGPFANRPATIVTRRRVLARLRDPMNVGDQPSNATIPLTPWSGVATSAVASEK